MPELRKDPLTGRWVIFATERPRRAADFAGKAPPRRKGPCVLCPGRERDMPPEVLAYRDGSGWRLRVVPSKFPALRVEGDLGRRAAGVYDAMNGVGAHEIVIETPTHARDLAASPPAAMVDVLRAWRERMQDLKRDARFRSVLALKNHGAAAGAGFDHPHSQLIAAPVVPAAVRDELENATAHYRLHDRCLLCDVIAEEVTSDLRVVAREQGVVAFAPFAARVPFETWIAPRAHAAAFEGADDGLVAAVAAALHGVLRRFARALRDPPYALVLHSAPFGEGDSPSFHWHVEVAPVLAARAGLGVAGGYHVNPLPPEDAARLLRETPLE